MPLPTIPFPSNFTSFDSAKQSASNTVIPSTSRTPNGSPNSQPTNTAPENAAAAPSNSSISVYSGLCDALNAFQKKLVDSGTYSIADQYEIIFNPASMGQEKVTLPDGLAYKTTPMANAKTPAAANSATDSMNTTGRIYQVTPGTQIVQFIDQVMRSSTYITKQANIQTNENTGISTKSANNSTKTGAQWYKITFAVTSLGYDSKRNDNAYKMTYIINQYPVTDLQSQFLPQGAYRGVHKSYNYWFTGQNTQVLNLEQEYNNTYFTILTSSAYGVNAQGDTPPSTGPKNESTNPANNVVPVAKAYAPGMSVSSQYEDKGAGLIGASAADYLYSLTPRGKITLKIIGDPAWLQQGEACNTVTADNFSYSPWNADNGINMDSGQILFDVKFNRPADYNFETGVVDVNAKTVNPNTGTSNLLQPQAHLVYTAMKVTSTFRQGKFEQELIGGIYSSYYTVNPLDPSGANARANTSSSSTAAGSREATFGPDGKVNSESDPNKWDSVPTSNASGVSPSTSSGTSTSTASETSADSSIMKADPQPQSPAWPPTSNGDIQEISDFGKKPLPINNNPQTPAEAAAAVARAEGVVPSPRTADEQSIYDIGQRLNPSQTMAPRDP